MAKSVKARNWCLLLYPDNDEHQQVLQKLIDDKYDMVYILHDKDPIENEHLEDGEEVKDTKKAHYHIVLKFPNAIWKTALEKKLKVESRFVEQCHSLNGAMQYLVHWGDPTKYQYGLDELQGSLKKDAIKACTESSKDVNDKIIEILDTIENLGRYVSVREFIRICSEMGYVSLAMRSPGLWCRYLDELNSRYDIRRFKNED